MTQEEADKLKRESFAIIVGLPTHAYSNEKALKVKWKELYVLIQSMVDKLEPEPLLPKPSFVFSIVYHSESCACRECKSRSEYEI